MKKIISSKPNPTKQVLVITLVTVIMFVVGYFVGKGLHHLFN